MAHALSRDDLAMRHLDHRAAFARIRDHRRRGLEVRRILAREYRQHAGEVGFDAQDIRVCAIGAQEVRVELSGEIPVRGVLAASSEQPVVLAATLEFPHAGCGQDCQAANFQPWGVRTQALRKRSRSELGCALLYLALPDFIDSIQLFFVSVTPEECVYRSSSCPSLSSAPKSPLIMASKRRSSRARISFSLLIATPPLRP